MSNLRTNFLRCQITSQCIRYQIQIQTNQLLEQRFYEELQAYFLAINQNIVFDFPYIYSVQPLQLRNFYFMLSSGQKLKVIVHSNTEKYESIKISSKIHRQMMKMTKFLYCSHLETCFNPFEQKQIDQNISTMPGFYIKSQSQQKLSGYYIVPVELIIDSKETFSQSTTLLNYSTGRFYTKENIVRYNKEKDQILFRNGDLVKKEQLKSITIKNLIGYEMASIMYSYNERIKVVCKNFSQLWQIKYDTRFMEVFFRFFPTGHLIFRGDKDKSLGQLLSPVSLNNYNYNFRNFFNDVCFQDDINCQIYFLLTEQIGEYMMTIVSWFQNIKQKMGLSFKIYISTFQSFKNIQEINSMVQAEPQHKERIYIVPKWKANDQTVQENQKLVQNLIDKGLFFHQMDIKFQQNQDLLVLRNLSLIYTKLRLNPWRIKQIPFGNAPFVAFSINVKLIKGVYAITVIGTMNAYLTKFTCLFQICQNETQISKNILKMCEECLQKFRSVHKCTPNRAIILRTGQAMSQIYLEYEELKDALLIKFNAKVTLVILQNDHPLRLFNQIDMNYISKDTIKKAQLMCMVSWKQDKFIELQLENPTYRIKILQIETLDQNFQNKIFQFLTKMSFGSVGNQFGKGLGFINFAEKLNVFSKTYNIQKMLPHLKEGLLLFL